MCIWYMCACKSLEMLKISTNAIWSPLLFSNLPLRSAAPPRMILATITAPVCSSLLMVAPWNETAYLTSSSRISSILTLTLLHNRALWVEVGYVIYTRGSWFFTSRTIFTDSSSKSSSKLSGRGGRTGSKFFCATVSCTKSIACIKEVRNSNVNGSCYSFQFSCSQHYRKVKLPPSHCHHKHKHKKRCSNYLTHHVNYILVYVDTWSKSGQ